MADSGEFQFRNRLLASLPPDDIEYLSEHFKPVVLPRRTQLEWPNKRIDFAYFPESGIVSIVSAAQDSEIEIGIIGREGMTGLPVVHLDDRGPYAAYMQVAGEALRVETDILSEAMQRSPSCQQVFLGFSRSFTIQISETAVANARATVLERLARWLLMAHDRLESGEIPLTHEFLAMMMGTRRPGVTEACHELTRRGLIDNTRGKLTITNREGLELFAGRFYGVAEHESVRLLARMRSPVTTNGSALAHSVK